MSSHHIHLDYDTDLDQCIEYTASVLHRIANDPEVILQLHPITRHKLYQALKKSTSLINTLQPEKKYSILPEKQKKLQDTELLNQTLIHQLRINPIFQTPRVKFGETLQSIPSKPIGISHKTHLCHICKCPYTQIHFFYARLCVSCGDFNYQKRFSEVKLSHRTALVTGGRIKIGFQTVLMLLRAGANVIITTRFPKDAARRYEKVEDATDWIHRLDIYGADFRDIRSIEYLCITIAKKYDQLDILINNACQTVRRPPLFYKHLLEGEMDHPLSIQANALIQNNEDYQSANLSHPLPALLSQIPLIDTDLTSSTQKFPPNHFDTDLQQIDLREFNSWTMLAPDVPMIELLEVHLINAIAPFVLNTRLKPMFLKSQHPDRYIINVSAMEGQFYHPSKDIRHPHTNMAKAALNMMTRTTAMEYAPDGIYMNSVDTGWITNEFPHSEKETYHTRDHHMPLDVIDGAARIVDPIFTGQNTTPRPFGQFFKNYAPTDW